MNREIADRIVRLRINSRLSQEEVANTLGVSTDTVEKWENSKASPNAENIIELGKLFNISLDELLHVSRGSDTRDMGADERSNGPRPEIYNEDDENLGEYDPLSDKRIVDDFDTMQDNKFTLSFLSRCYPVIVVIIYLIIGFMFRLWHPGWILFLTIPVFYAYYNSINK